MLRITKGPNRTLFTSFGPSDASTIASDWCAASTTPPLHESHFVRSFPVKSSAEPCQRARQEELVLSFFFSFEV
jgi:hypothetical protein